MDLLDIQRTGFIPQLSHHLDVIPRVQPIECIAELLRWFVCSACDDAEARLDIYEDMSPCDVIRLRSDRALQDV